MDESSVLFALFPPDDPGGGFVGVYGVVPEPSRGPLLFAGLLVTGILARGFGRA